MSKSLEERIAAAKAKQAALNERLNALQAKAKTEQRKRDTRRKIVIGGAILLELQKNPEVAKALKAVLNRNVSRAIDRAVIADLLPATTSPSDPR